MRLALPTAIFHRTPISSPSYSLLPFSPSRANALSVPVLCAGDSHVPANKDGKHDDDDFLRIYWNHHHVGGPADTNDHKKDDKKHDKKDVKKDDKKHEKKDVKKDDEKHDKKDVKKGDKKHEDKKGDDDDKKHHKGDFKKKLEAHHDEYKKKVEEHKKTYKKKVEDHKKAYKKKVEEHKRHFHDGGVGGHDDDDHKTNRGGDRPSQPR